MVSVSFNQEQFSSFLEDSECVGQKLDLRAPAGNKLGPEGARLLAGQIPDARLQALEAASSSVHQDRAELLSTTLRVRRSGQHSASPVSFALFRF